MTIGSPSAGTTKNDGLQVVDFSHTTRASIRSDAKLLAITRLGANQQNSLSYSNQRVSFKATGDMRGNAKRAAPIQLGRLSTNDIGAISPQNLNRFKTLSQGGKHSVATDNASSAAATPAMKHTATDTNTRRIDFSQCQDTSKKSAFRARLKASFHDMKKAVAQNAQKLAAGNFLPAQRPQARHDKTT